LLADSCDKNDKRAGYLWAEYALVFQGRRQLVWSPGLKDMIGLKEIADEEAAKDEQQNGQMEEGRANVSHKDWTGRVANRRDDRRANLVERAEEIGVEAAVAELISDDVSIDDEVIEKDPVKSARDDEACSVLDQMIAEIDEIMKPRPGGLAEKALALAQRHQGIQSPPLGDFESPAARLATTPDICDSEGDVSRPKGLARHRATHTTRNALAPGDTRSVASPAG
jgi:hypothetical protein